MKENIAVLFTISHVENTDHMEDALLKENNWKGKNNKVR